MHKFQDVNKVQILTRKYLGEILFGEDGGRNKKYNFR